MFIEEGNPLSSSAEGIEPTRGAKKQDTKQECYVCHKWYCRVNRHLREVHKIGTGDTLGQSADDIAGSSQPKNVAVKKTANAGKKKSNAVPKTAASSKPEAELRCGQCKTDYKESENVDNCCVWYSGTHKGMYIVNEDSSFWHGWKEWYGPPDSAHCREEYRNEGGYIWSICGCNRDTGECSRSGKHKPEGEPLSDDDVELEYVEQDKLPSKKKNTKKNSKRKAWSIQ